MIRINRLSVAKAAAILSVIPVLIYASATKTDVGSAGVPNESSCARCHSGNSTFPGSVKVDFPGKLTYVPGQTQRLTVTVADPDQKRWGFQLTARQASASRVQAGSFTPGTDKFTQVMCFDITTQEQLDGPCSGATTLQYIEHTDAGTRRGQSASATYTFDWTPPANDLGEVTIYVMGLAANDDTSVYGDRQYSKNYTLTSPQSVLPLTSKVLNAASGKTPISPGAWVSVYGQNLASTTRSWEAKDIVNGKLPTELDGVRVTINSNFAAVAYISPTQINVLAPADAGIGAAASPVYVQVLNNGVAADPILVPSQAIAPSFFLWSNRYSVATRPDGSIAASTSQFPAGVATPAKSGEVIILWGTGFGPTTPALAAGIQTPSDKLYQTATLPVILIDGAPVKVIGAALSPGSAGLCQIAIEVPQVPWDGDHTISAQIAGVSSPQGPLLNIQR